MAGCFGAAWAKWAFTPVCSTGYGAHDPRSEPGTGFADADRMLTARGGHGA